MANGGLRRIMNLGFPKRKLNPTLKISQILDWQQISESNSICIRTPSHPWCLFVLRSWVRVSVIRQGSFVAMPVFIITVIISYFPYITLPFCASSVGWLEFNVPFQHNYSSAISV